MHHGLHGIAHEDDVVGGIGNHDVRAGFVECLHHTFIGDGSLIGFCHFGACGIDYFRYALLLARQLFHALVKLALGVLVHQVHCTHIHIHVRLDEVIDRPRHRGISAWQRLHRHHMGNGTLLMESCHFGLRTLKTVQDALHVRQRCDQLPGFIRSDRVQLNRQVTVGKLIGCLHGHLYRGHDGPGDDECQRCC